jgi:hypothetical protein
MLVVEDGLAGEFGSVAELAADIEVDVESSDGAGETLVLGRATDGLSDVNSPRSVMALKALLKSDSLRNRN